MIGSHLIRRLLKEGVTVRALVRKTSNTRLLESLGGVELVVGDIKDPTEKLKGYCTGFEYVVHCAALIEHCADRIQMYRVNVEALENLLKACEGQPIKKFLVMGSMAVLGMGRQENLDETAPYIETGDNYNFTKIEAEKLAMKYAREKGMPVVIIRPPYVYGPGDRQFFPRLVTRLEQGNFAYIGDGNNPFEIAYVGNLVEAMWLALKSDRASRQVFMITDGKPITRRQLVETICEEMGLPKPKVKVPYLIAKFICPVLEAAAKMSGMRWQPPLNRFRLKFLYPNMTFNISKARRELGYEPPFTLEEALRYTIKWYKEEKASK